MSTPALLGNLPAAWALALPLLVPLLVAGGALLFPDRARLQNALGLLGGGLLLGSGIIILKGSLAGPLPSVRMGGWPQGVGISLGADPLTGLMLTLAGVMACVTLLYAAEDRRRSPFVVPLVMVTLLGVNGAFLTRDLFNLYVWFEVLLAGSFGLLVVTGGAAGREAAVKSLTLNLLGSLFFLLAVGATYGVAGTLDMTLLQDRLGLVFAQRPALVTGLAMLLVAAFAVKAALFPFHSWLPASYHVPPAGVCALFAALLTKVGIYSLLRVLTLPFSAVEGPLPLLGIMAAATMLIGVFGAVTRQEMKSILAWHSISQVGYMAAGVVLLTAPEPEVRIAGVAASVFFLIHHGLVKPALFLVAGLVARLQGTTHLPSNGGLYQERPALAVLFLLAALSLVGIPPLSGFWAKLGVVQATLAAGQGWLTAAALGAGIVTMMSMIKIWNEVFWKARPETGDDDHAGNGQARWVATLALTVLITLVGLQPRPLLNWSEKAAVALMADRDRTLDSGEAQP